MRSCRVGVQRLVRFPGDVFRQRVERSHRQVDHAVEIPLKNVHDNGLLFARQYAIRTATKMSQKVKKK